MAQNTDTRSSKSFEDLEREHLEGESFQRFLLSSSFSSKTGKSDTSDRFAFRDCAYSAICLAIAAKC